MPRVLPPPSADDALAVFPDPIDLVGIDNVASGPTGHAVALPVRRAHEVSPGSAEQTVATRAPDQDVATTQAVEDVVAAEPAKLIATCRAAQYIRSRRPRTH